MRSPSATGGTRRTDKHFLSAPKGKCYCLGHNNFHIQGRFFVFLKDCSRRRRPLLWPSTSLAPGRVTGRCLKNYRLLASCFSVWLVQAWAGLLQFSKTSERSYASPDSLYSYWAWLARLFTTGIWYCANCDWKLSWYKPLFFRKQIITLIYSSPVQQA